MNHQRSGSRFADQQRFDQQLKRCPNTDLGRLCALMLMRYCNPALAEQLKWRGRCLCGALVKYHTGQNRSCPRVQCQDCIRRAIESA